MQDWVKMTSPSVARRVAQLRRAAGELAATGADQLAVAAATTHGQVATSLDVGDSPSFLFNLL